MRTLLFFFCAGLTIMGMFSGCHHHPADLVLRNGKIVTVDKHKPEAQALAVREGVILAVGSDREIDPYVSDRTQVVDLEGRLAIPGFIDGHGHFMGLGLSKMRLDLTRADSWKDIVEMVRHKASTLRPGEWIVGRGWHQEKWTQAPTPNLNGLPYHDELSKASTANPVLLIHASGHSCIANQKAMIAAGIDRDTPDPPGGQILHDEMGDPIGVFRETAVDSLDEALKTWQATRTPAEMDEDQRKAVILATQECLRHGVTSFQDAGSPLATVDFYRRLAESGELGIRLWVMLSDSNPELADKLGRYRMIGQGKHRLTVRAIKRLIDGALGSHGAWLLEPYSDLSESSGLNMTPVEEITETGRMAVREGFQLCVHAIGDRGNREVLDLYRKVFAENPERKDLRWRVEHAQHLHPDDIPRFSKMGVIASMQGVHCTSDGPWVEKRIGEKRAREGAYAWRSLLDSGAMVSNGTDTPVESVNPIPGFHALVTRKMKNGKSFHPGQRMTRKEALEAYTRNAAYAAFEEGIKGSLAPGKLADIVVLSKDILTVPEEEIPGTRVFITILGGKIVYQSR